jgi:salicylate hydroxylase
MWSKIRDRIVGDGQPRVSGHIAYRAVLKKDEVPPDLWRPDVILWAGPRTHFVHYPLRRGELFNLVAVFHSDRYEEGWNLEADATVLWAHFKGQRPEVLRMLERIETWRMWVLCDREPVKDWTKGHVVLLGDAAHPMLQYLAQGAAMAVEDAVCLADNVAAQPNDLPAAFDAYVNQRYLRTARVQIMARVYGDFYHARGPGPNCATRCSAAAPRKTPLKESPGFMAAAIKCLPFCACYRERQSHEGLWRDIDPCRRLDRHPAHRGPRI